MLRPMTVVEVYRWRVPARGRRRGYLSAVHLTREEALREYGPDAQPDPSTRRERQVLETDAERRAAMFRYQSAGFDGPRS